jgi:16S rRNA (cytosine1402-N4)-methyltransferase
MEFSHKSVLLDECIDGLNIKSDGIYIDGTLGGGGHSSEILKKLNVNGTLIGIDQDQEAIKAAGKRLSDIESKAKLILVNTNFEDIKEVCLDNDITGVDGILLDLGVSSFQLDESSRGFSYQHNAELDMRMDTRNDFSAVNVVNEYTESELTKVIRDYGEENWASRIAKFIVEARKVKSIDTTFELVEIIKTAIPSAARRDGPHPAKRTFQAIRIEVNGELRILKQAVEDCFEVLNRNGRLCVITFHSLEDRIVKDVISNLSRSCTCPKEIPICICGGKAKTKKISKKPIIASEKELLENPRARSAKLRIAEKLY